MFSLLIRNRFKTVKWDVDEIFIKLILGIDTLPLIIELGIKFSLNLNYTTSSKTSKIFFPLFG